MTGARLKPATLRDYIAESVAEHLKSYDVAEFCVRVGLEAQGDGEDPFRSKRVYVRSKLMGLDVAQLLSVALKVLDEWDDDGLQALVSSAAIRGVQGEMKNLIFASDGPKPEIVLRDAINNVIEITRNAQYCLVYDRPLSDHGLSWGDLVTWWATDRLKTDNLDVAARHLWLRLSQSLDSDAERVLFRAYSRRYGSAGLSTPALVPQVYLHYDPYVRRRLETGRLFRQRMDFLLLLRRRTRIVLEVDGKHHYSTESGQASPGLYARMMLEDRQLRLDGYEIFRFGGSELAGSELESRPMLDAFFDNLLERYQE